MANKKKYKDEKQVFLLWMEGDTGRFVRALKSEIPEYIKLYGVPTKKWII